MATSKRLIIPGRKLHHLFLAHTATSMHPLLEVVLGPGKNLLDLDTHTASTFGRHLRISTKNPLAKTISHHFPDTPICNQTSINGEKHTIEPYLIASDWQVMRIIEDQLRSLKNISFVDAEVEEQKSMAKDQHDIEQNFYSMFHSMPDTASTRLIVKGRHTEGFSACIDPCQHDDYRHEVLTYYPTVLGKDEATVFELNTHTWATLGDLCRAIKATTPEIDINKFLKATQNAIDSDLSYQHFHFTANLWGVLNKGSEFRPYLNRFTMPQELISDKRLEVIAKRTVNEIIAAPISSSKQSLWPNDGAHSGKPTLVDTLSAPSI